MQYVSKNNIENAREDIEKILIKFGFSGNTVLAIDFTHFNEKHDDCFDIKFKMLAHPKYNTILNEEQSEKGKYAYFEKKFNKIIKDLNNEIEYDSNGSLFFSEFSEKNQTIDLDFNPNDWHNKLISKGFGGCSIILSKQHGEAQSIVYLILSKRLINIDVEVDFLTDSGKISDINIKNCCEEIFLFLESLLIDEMIHCLHSDRWEAEKETKAIAQYKKDLENKIDSFGHVMFNNLSGNLNDFLEISECKGNEPICKINQQISNIQKRNNFISIGLQLLNKKDNSTVEALQNINTLDEMCSLITKKHILEKAKSLKYNYMCSQSYSITGFQNDIFILLWNLLSNTDKHNYLENNLLENTIYFDVLVENNTVFIVFKNISNSFKKEILRKILNGTEVLESRKGMWTVLETIKKLNWKAELKEEENPNAINLWITTNFLQQT